LREGVFQETMSNMKWDRHYCVLPLLVLLSTLAACQKKAASQSSPGESTPVSTPEPVNARRLTDADLDKSNWMTHGRTYAEQRFSPLDQVNISTVGQLKLAWFMELAADERGQQSTPLVVDGTMFITTSWSRVVALDAANGKVLWRHDPRVPREWGINACCDVVNRGVAYWEGKIYVGTLDGRLVALKASDGTPLWETVVIDRAERASITGAPRIIKGRVFIGSAGGDFAVRGRMTAVNANSGAILWRTFTVPGDPSVAPENLHLPAAQKTWTGQWWKQGGGGTVWDAMAYDSALDLLYVGTGNGSPWPRSVRSPKGGDNLYVSSIIAMKGETGEYVWHYQTTPGDEWGYDAASQLVLAELIVDGQWRSVLIQAAANGFVYVLDRASGKLLSGTPFVPVNWATGLDANGRPVESPVARYNKTRKPLVIHPGPRGAHSWHPMSFNPRSGLLYIPAMLNSAQLSMEKAQSPSRYALGRGVLVSSHTESAPDSSRLIAWDPIQQEAVWSIDRPSPEASGVLASAGSLVFQGSTMGILEALHAGSGKSLWRFDAGTSITAAPIAYEANGNQMIAVMSGAGGAAQMAGGSHMVRHRAASNTPRLLVFSLNGTAQLPQPPAPAAPSIAQNLLPAGAPADVTRGQALYARFCARCHGDNTINTGPLVDLKHTSYLSSATQWQRVVFSGLLGARGMPGFMAEINDSDAEAVRVYVASIAVQQVNAP
jgi:quinohemoprotein ethanol dehydrogenase